jgi:transcriptional regulator with XRE-family HTH domain
MEAFNERLRRFAKELGISNAEVARRAGLSARQYGHYVEGRREPNLRAIVRICAALGITPNDLLLDRQSTAKASERDKFRSRLITDTNTLEIDDLKLAAHLISAMVKHRSAASRRPAR